MIATSLILAGTCASATFVPADPSPTSASRAAVQATRSKDVARWQSRFERRAFQTRSGVILPYRVARPAAGVPRPLVLVLHGSGAMGSDNEGQLGPFASAWAQLVDDREDPPIVLVPQVSERSADYILCDGLPCSSRPGPSFTAILELLDSFSRSKAVDHRRIYVVGFSMGGSAALQLALARPNLIAGMVVFAPVPPSKERVEKLKRLSLLVVHGRLDTENPFEVMTSWVGELNRAGGHVAFSARERMGHQVPDDMLTDPVWRRRLLRK